MALELMTVVAVAAAALLICAALVFNSLITARNRVRNAWSQIDVQLKKRAGVIYNMAEIVKGYAKHEKSVFTNVARQRAAVAGASSSRDSLKTNNLLAQAFRSVFAVAENYPQLMASGNFLELQSQLAKIEGDIARARMVYNDVVTIYNTNISVFPQNIVAALLGFKAEKLLEADDIERAGVRLKI